MKFAEFHHVFAGAEGQVADAYLRFVGSSNTVPVVVVDITDADYTNFFAARSPLSPDALTSLVDVLRDSTAVVVGVDIRTDPTNAAESASYRNYRPPSSGPPVVWAAPIESSRNPPALHALGFWDWMRGREQLRVSPAPVLGRPVDPTGAISNGHDSWGLVVFPRERDGRIRRMPSVWVSTRDDLTYHNTLSTKLVDVYCASNASMWRTCETPPAAGESPHDTDGSGHSFVYVPFPSNTRETIQRQALNEIVSCAEPRRTDNPPCTTWELAAGARQTLQGKIVLLGGTYNYPDGDFHETPLGVTSGLMINAYAVRAELEGLTLDDLAHRTTFLADVAVGIAVGWLWWIGGGRWSKLQRLGVVLVLVPAVAFVAGEWLFEHDGIL
jgi:hypothetical protein